jgi:predicted dehydrogenase
LGRYSENAFIPTVNLLQRSEVVSLFSHNKERVKNLAVKFGIPGAFTNYDEFLNSDISAVYIGSSNADHYSQVLKAAKAGKHILCDKPIALDSQQAEEMVNVCEENKVQLAINYVHRFHPLIVKARELLEAQLLGKLVSVNVSFNVDFPPDENFRFKKSLSGGGALRDLGTHMIDLLRFFGGEITSINGVIDNVVYKSEVEDFASAIVTFKNSGHGYFNVSFNNKRAFNRIELLGHKGAISIERLIGTKFFPGKMTILLEGETKKSFRRGGVNKLIYLLRSVQKSFLKNETPLVTGMDGLINMRLMEELESKCLKNKN